MCWCIPVHLIFKGVLDCHLYSDCSQKGQSMACRLQEAKESQTQKDVWCQTQTHKMLTT